MNVKFLKSTLKILSWVFVFIASISFFGAIKNMDNVTNINMLQKIICVLPEVFEPLFYACIGFLLSSKNN